jgi:DNA-directed RNA polymerase specialized sigma24 family protein
VWGRDGFAEFFRAEAAPLAAVARRAGFGLEQSKDAAQEALSRTYPRWSHLQQPQAWVRVVAYNTAFEVWLTTSHEKLIESTRQALDVDAMLTQAKRYEVTSIRAARRAPDRVAHDLRAALPARSPGAWH